MKVIVARRADRDIRVIQAWLRERSTRGAEKWLDAFESVLQRLSRTPESGAPAAESEAFGVDLRDLIFKTPRGRPYRLIFTVQDEVIHVLSVRGPGQDLLQPGELDFPE